MQYVSINKYFLNIFKSVLNIIYIILVIYIYSITYVYIYQSIFITFFNIIILIHDRLNREI